MAGAAWRMHVLGLNHTDMDACSTHPFCASSGACCPRDRNGVQACTPGTLGVQVRCGDPAGANCCGCRTWS